MTKKRLPTELRKENILAVALPLAAKRGYTNITRDEIAAAVGVTGSAIQYHFGTVGKLRTEIMRYAVKQRHARVVAQGLAVRDPRAMKADKGLKQLARAAV